MQGIPTTSSDLYYNTLGDIRMMPNQKDLVLGWNVNNSGTYLLSDGPFESTYKGRQIRVQHWKDKDVREVMVENLDVVDFTQLNIDSQVFWNTQLSKRTAMGSLTALDRVTQSELLHNPNDVIEYARALIYLLDAVHCAGFTLKGLLHNCRKILQ